MIYYKVDPDNPDVKAIAHAAQVLASGGLVIFPTETVYGLGVRMDDEQALKKVYDIKGRSDHKPLTLHIRNTGVIYEFAAAVPENVKALIEKHLPGPLTLILPSKDGSTLGFRVPDDAVAAALINAADILIGATSVNISGQPSACAVEDIPDSIKNSVDIIIDAGVTRYKGASTIVSAVGSEITVLREGPIKIST